MNTNVVVGIKTVNDDTGAKQAEKTIDKVKSSSQNAGKTFNDSFDTKTVSDGIKNVKNSVELLGGSLGKIDKITSFFKGGWIGFLIASVGVFIAKLQQAANLKKQVEKLQDTDREDISKSNLQFLTIEQNTFSKIIDRLKQINTYDLITNDLLTQQQGLLTLIKNQYGDINISIDKSTNRIKNLLQIQKDLLKIIHERKLAQLQLDKQVKMQQTHVAAQQFIQTADGKIVKNQSQAVKNQVGADFEFETTYQKTGSKLKGTQQSNISRQMKVLFQEYNKQSDLIKKLAIAEKILLQFRKDKSRINDKQYKTFSEYVKKLRQAAHIQSKINGEVSSYELQGKYLDSYQQGVKDRQKEKTEHKIKQTEFQFNYGRYSENLFVLKMRNEFLQKGVELNQQQLRDLWKQQQALKQITTDLSRKNEMESLYDEQKLTQYLISGDIKRYQIAKKILQLRKKGQIWSQNQLQSWYKQQKQNKDLSAQQKLFQKGRQILRDNKPKTLENYISNYQQANNKKVSKNEKNLLQAMFGLQQLKNRKIESYRLDTNDLTARGGLKGGAYSNTKTVNEQIKDINIQQKTLLQQIRDIVKGVNTVTGAK